jgi:hypothetical protein
MNGGVRSTGWADFNNRLHSDRFSAACGSKPAHEPGVKFFAAFSVLHAELQRSFLK